MQFDEYRKFDAIGLADLVASKEVTPGELLDVALARTAEVNPAINALIVDLEKSARTAIDQGLPDGPLRGVPFLIKDVTVQMKGVTTSAGSRLLVDTVADFDSAIVTAFRNAGLVTFAKTNAPEFGLMPITEPELYGPCRNPWDLSLTPGGSSGGASAAISAGIVPAAHGSDGGGSIRIPASCCGLVGLKPSHGRVSLAPAGEGWGGLAVQHVLTRSVRDCAILLDIDSKPQPGDPFWLSIPAQPFVETAKRPPGKLKIAYTTSALVYGEIDPVCAAAVKDAAALCESLGHDVVEAAPQSDYIDMAIASNTLVAAAVTALVEAEAERRGTPIREGDVEHLTWKIYQDGLTRQAHEVVAAHQSLNNHRRRMAKFFEEYDVLLLSTLGSPPVPIGHFTADIMDEDPLLYAMSVTHFMPNTSPFNNAGNPAISLPLYWNEDGIPIGVQFAAKAAEEALLLQLATQLEEARPWFDRVPGL